MGAAAAPTFFITATCLLYTCTLRPAGHKWGSDPNMIRSYPHIPIISWSLKRHKTPVSEALSVMAVRTKVCRVCVVTWMITRLSGGHGEVLIYAGIASARSRHAALLKYSTPGPQQSAGTGNQAENTSPLLKFLSTLSIGRTKDLVWEQ